MALKTVILAAAALLAAGVSAQTMKLDHWTPAQLLERAQHLQQQAAQGDGSASETLDKYPHHYTMLAFRSRNGGGELHENYADLFYILDGKATVATGGSLVDRHTTAPGEVRGSSVDGGSRQDVKAGDVVHIPAGMPHQMLIPEGSTVTYFVVKVQEKE
ncbi:MAG TPA: cupin domain-containing protein [Terracidiphilus sp.]|jgi:mannose-6-phosphate isomerase-like protein (cupin superfamily)